MKQGTMNILFFILKTKLLKNGEAPILMRITIDGHYEEARIQRSVLPKQWDSAKGCSKGKDRTAKELNAYIAELSALAFQKHKELMLELALITPKLLLKRVFGKETEMRTLLGTMNEEIEKMKKAVNIDYAPVTINRYINVMKKLQKAIPDFYNSIVNENRGASRFYSLLLKFGLMERVIASRDVSKIKSGEIDWNSVNKIWAQQRKESIEFLNRNLIGNKH